MKWLGILYEDLSIKVHPVNRRNEVIIAKSAPAIKEQFGPFEAPNMIQAKLRLRGIMVAVGFRVPNAF